MEVLCSERVAVEQGSFEQAARKGRKYRKSAQKRQNDRFSTNAVMLMGITGRLTTENPAAPAHKLSS